jgi:hypothetical protein
LAAAADGEDVTALVAGFGGFHRARPPPPGSIAKIFKAKEIDMGYLPLELSPWLTAEARLWGRALFYFYSSSIAGLWGDVCQICLDCKLFGMI